MAIQKPAGNGPRRFGFGERAKPGQDFRFLAICEDVSHDGPVSLHRVVDSLFRPAADFPFDLKLWAAVSVVAMPEKAGKYLDLLAYVLDKKRSLDPQPIAGYAGTPVILPSDLGPRVYTIPITVPIAYPCLYGFYLFDRDGAFAEPETLLANYVYGVLESPSRETSIL